MLSCASWRPEPTRFGMVQLVACEPAGGAAGVISAGTGTGAVYVMIVGPVGPGGEGAGAGAGGPPQAASAVTARARTALRIGISCVASGGSAGDEMVHP